MCEGKKENPSKKSKQQHDGGHRSSADRCFVGFVVTGRDGRPIDALPP